jgi:V/A-type H+-transporting ATPase subunit I
MAIASMQKVQILGVKKDLPAVLNLIQEEGVMEIEEVPSQEIAQFELQPYEAEAASLDHDIKNLEFAIQVLMKHEPKEEADRESLSMEQAQELYLNYDFNKVVENLQSLSAEHMELRAQMEASSEEEKPSFEGKLKHSEEKLQKIASKELYSLRVLHSLKTDKLEQNQMMSKAKTTEYCFVLTGWVPVNAVNKLEEKLSKIADISIEALEKGSNEEAPIVLHNNKLVSPFEVVTNLYGAPKDTDPDPTPLLSGFFILFFATCLTDAGYGLVLFVLMSCILRFGKKMLDSESKKFVTLLKWAGLVTIFVSIPFGGYFGMTTAQAPAFMSNGDLFKFQLINPMSGSGAITFLVIAFIAGIIHILTGMAVGGVWKIRQGQWKDAILDNFLWIYFILSILAFALTKMDILPASLASVATYMTLGGAAALVLTQGRAQKSIVGKFGVGLISLYNVISYGSDILSYSRLMALGLATGVIAFAVNTVASIAMDMIPYVGIVVAIVILIVGHTANIALNTMGAFIHSSRLQFVEFFSKFLEAGGRAFKPFKKTSKFFINQ